MLRDVALPCFERWRAVDAGRLYRDSLAGLPSRSRLLGRKDV